MIREVDGTYDYHLTSEEWLRRMRSALRTTMGMTVFAKAFSSMVVHPKQFATMILCMLISESWNWQFRGPTPPTTLLRQTWAYQG